MAIAYIGLGSNLGDRAENLKNAIKEISSLPRVAVFRKSTVTETEPVDYRDQPRFLNQVIIIETALAPLDLLAALKNTEQELGREKSIPKGPRSIDLDILLYDDMILETEELTIPHPEITNRRFVIDHLVELNPGLTDPRTRKKYRTML
jgi:2-amino-4-hydroxy-6-hydroxymethyldihydropteridine diphosphokinase